MAKENGEVFDFEQKFQSVTFFESLAVNKINSFLIEEWMCRSSTSIFD